MVLSFGKFIADGSTNVIPHEVKLSGTLRTLDETWRLECKNHIRRIVNETAVAYGCSCDIELSDGYPSVSNNPEITKAAKTFATEIVGASNVAELEVRMTGEDFGFFTQAYPCTFYRFGVKGQCNAQTGNIHTATFQMDLEAFKTSVPVMSWIAWQMLQN
jgi:hippurate hydrolase